MSYNPQVALTLVIIGAIILAAIFLLHRTGKKKPEHASRRPVPQSRREPTLGAASASEDSAETGVSGGPEEAPETGERVRQEPLLPEPAGETGHEPEHDEPASEEVVEETDTGERKLVTLFLRVRGDRRITGVQLLDAALKAGLEFGEMNVFHRRHEGGERAVFTMANLVKPGNFDPTAWNLFESPGLTLFMELPGPTSALDGWDAMLATGQRLAKLLDVDLLDDAQCEISRQRIAQMREELREYDREFGF